ncbi:MAG TPA: carbohydrate ABC transporter permease [Ktedonobacteraceae bacterium]|nr:carbohydrate ABC transporter permease [Ktedonobacteraceae bacterium]
MGLTTHKARASVEAHENVVIRPARPFSRRYLGLVLNYLLMSLLAVFFLFPIVFMIVSSFKADENQLLQDVTTVRAFIPYGDISLQNYSDAFQRFPFGLYLFNSLFIVTCIVVLGLLVNSLIAYSLARMPFPGRKLILSIVVALVVIPFESVAVPLLLLVNQLPWFNGATTWINSYQVQILPFIADAFSIFLFYQFFIDIPRDIEEAAFVDGASRWRIYWQLIVPLSRPVFITVAIWQFLVHIGDFLWPLLVTRGDTYRPLMVGMRFFFGQAPLIWGDIMAFASMITIFMLIVFLLFQRWFLRSAASAGITG